MAEKIVKDSQGLAKDLVNDCISRKAAIEKATKDHDFFRGATTPTDKARRDELLNVICWLGELPSAQPKSYREGYQAGFKDAQPERKRGKWKMDLKRHVFVCSICGAWQVFNCNYCSNCGTDMREVDE